MPTQRLVLIYGAVLLAGALTVWAITALPSTTGVSVVLVALVGVRLLYLRKSS